MKNDLCCLQSQPAKVNKRKRNEKTKLAAQHTNITYMAPIPISKQIRANNRHNCDRGTAVFNL